MRCARKYEVFMGNISTNCLSVICSEFHIYDTVYSYLQDHEAIKYLEPSSGYYTRLSYSQTDWFSDTEHMGWNRIRAL